MGESDTRNPNKNFIEEMGRDIVMALTNAFLKTCKEVYSGKR
jgi:hypothetical protein